MVPQEVIDAPARARLVVMGGSAGAVGVLRGLLAPLHIKVPIIVVLHVAPGRNDGLRLLFGRECVMPVQDPVDKAPVEAGTIYFAPPDYHLLLEKNGTFALSVGPKVNYCRPSIDVLFESAADVYQPDVVAVILSGANEDGAAGARRIREVGGLIMVQEPTTCESAAMPLAAIQTAAPQVVGNTQTLAGILAKVVPCAGGSD